MKRISLPLACSFVGIALLSPAPLQAAPANTPTDVQSVADRELARRQEYIRRAHDYIAAGDKAMKENEFETAMSNYKTVCDTLPISEATKSVRHRAVDGYSSAGVAFAKQRIAEGRFKDAEIALKNILDPNYNPHCGAAKSLLAKIADPQYFNKTITPKLHGDVERIKELMIDADGYYNTGRYDLAHKRYEEVLSIDPYNTAARKGDDKVLKAKTDYAIEGYNHTRGDLMYKVEKGWDLPVKKYGRERTVIIENQQTDTKQTQKISEKLKTIIIPKIEFKNATVREAIDFLKLKSKDLDLGESDPSKRGVNIVLKMESSAPAPAAGAGTPAGTGLPGTDATTGLPVDSTSLPGVPASAPSAASLGDQAITLSLSNVPLGEALNYVTKLANLKYKLDPYAVYVVPQSEPTDILVTKEYKVPPGFISSTPSAGGDAGGLASTQPGGSALTDTTRGGRAIGARDSAKDFLGKAGVVFPAGAYANYFPSTSRLVVRNTQEQLDLVDQLVDSAISVQPVQVEIEAKFVEISQQNLKELSFDWLIGQTSIPGSSGRIWGSGGTPGSTSAGVSPSDWPFSTTGLQPVTASNRTGQTAISANAIDSLLFPSKGVTSAAPAILGLAGVMTDPTFQVVMRALNQKKGVDLLSSPKLTTKSGEHAQIEIIREFTYPNQFQPPEIDKNGGNNNGGYNGGFPVTNVQIPTVTPTTPTSFTTRNTGVTMEVEPTVGPDGTTIDLKLVPQVVEFEGFINYGSPIKTVNPSAFNSMLKSLSGGDQGIVLTDNVINQPIFSTRKITTSVSVWDGQTVVLGGLMREDVQKVEDKVPLLGDVPVVGRLFRSQVDQHLKRNLIIFVTAKLVNPAGDAVHPDDEKEEVVEPLAQPEALQPPPMPEMPLLGK